MSSSMINRATEQDADEIERQRVEYLRMHHERLQQRQRLETERRLQEHARDQQEIDARFNAIQTLKQKKAIELQQLQARRAIGSVQPATSSPPSPQMPGAYARLDDLDSDTLALVAAQQSMREMVPPLNTRGKYHAQFMHDAYPIAGAQFKLERERDLCISAKKKLLLAAKGSSSSAPSLGRTNGSRGDLFTSSYRKLDFYVDQMTQVLQREQESVKIAAKDRLVRLVHVRHEEGLQQFWRIFHTAHHREVVAWIKAHSFLDVNVPVTLAKSSSTSPSTLLHFQPNKEIGVTPLMAACRAVHLELVQLLLDQGAVVHLATANGDTALHFLWKDWDSTHSDSMKGVTERIMNSAHARGIIAVLIAHRIDVNAQNAFGETALQLCVRLGLEDCAKLLLENGADTYACDRKGKHAIAYAQEHKFENLYRLLLNHKIIDQVKLREEQRRHSESLLKLKRGALTATWSSSPDELFARLLVQDQRVGHLRNQYIDRMGRVIACDDDSGEDEEEGSDTAKYAR